MLWLSVISEFMYIGLLAMGFLLMCVEAICLCTKREMSSLKINAYAAMCTVLSGEDTQHFLLKVIPQRGHTLVWGLFAFFQCVMLFLLCMLAAFLQVLDVPCFNTPESDPFNLNQECRTRGTK